MAEEIKQKVEQVAAKAPEVATPGKVALVLLLGLVILAGGLSTIQAPINAALKVHFTGDFRTATVISYFMSAVLLTILAIIMHAPKFKLTIKGTRWWHWLGGVVGVTYVLGFTVATANLGSASATSGLVLGQLVFGLIVDQFGLIGMPKRKITVQRVAGVLLVFVGALLVFNF